MLELIIIVLIMAFIYVKFGEFFKQFNNKLKGSSFEVKMKKIILKYFPNAKIRNNIIIKNGRYSKEIDVVAMTKKEFFIIEAKNYNYCRIVGDIDGRYWTCIYDNGKKYKLYNPIFQAEAGVKSLNKHISNINFKYMVVFSNSCKLSDNLINHKNVYNETSFEKELVNMKCRLDVYSDKYIDDVCSKIDSLETVSKSEHLKNIEKIKSQKAH